MKARLILFLVLSMALFMSCDLRSRTAKEEMDKFSGTPTPSISPIPSEVPIDPADIVAVDTTVEGDTLTVDGDKLNKQLDCTKFNPVMIDGNANVVTIKGTCRRIMANGDGNEITADAAMEFVFNGTGNTLRYSRFINGKRPSVTENQAGNIIEKVPTETVNKKIVK